MLNAYMALNSTGRNEYSLKTLTHSFAGNYAVDVTNVLKVPTEKLLEYNLIDTLCTRYVYDSYPVENEELSTFLHDTVKLLIITELTGMPMDMDKVLELEKDLTTLKEELVDKVKNNKKVKEALDIIRQDKLDKINTKLKTKQHGFDKVKDVEFNYNSNQQMAVLLYDVIGLEVLEYTESGQKSVARDTLEELINYGKEVELLE